MLCKPSSSGRLRDKVFSCIGVIWCIWLTWLCFVFLLFLYAVELKGMSQNFSKLTPSAQINNEELGAFKIFSFDLEKKHISILEVFLLLCDGGEQRKFGNLLQWLKYIFLSGKQSTKMKACTSPNASKNKCFALPSIAPRMFSNPDLFFLLFFPNRSTVVPLSHLF